MTKDISYWDYLKLEQLLNLQDGIGRGPSVDEHLFIIIHQAYELWFRQILLELRAGRDRLLQEQVPETDISYIVHHFDRVVEILKLAVQQFSVLETLSPQQFLVFRGDLGTASGFQSFQMRQMEMLLGLRDEHRIKMGKHSVVDYLKKSAMSSQSGEFVSEELDRSIKEPSLLDALEQWLYRTPINGSQPGDEDDEITVRAFINEYLDQHSLIYEQHIKQLGAYEEEQVYRERYEKIISQMRDYLTAKNDEDHSRRMRVRAAVLFIESHFELPLLAWPRMLLDKIVEIESQLVIWRNRHARAVERIIGRRVGTGGSPGVDYLDKTTSYRIFTDLWQVRTILLARQYMPDVLNQETYSFKMD